MRQIWNMFFLPSQHISIIFIVGNTMEICESIILTYFHHISIIFPMEIWGCAPSVKLFNWTTGHMDPYDNYGSRLKGKAAPMPKKERKCKKGWCMDCKDVHRDMNLKGGVMSWNGQLYSFIFIFYIYITPIYKEYVLTRSCD